jgi:hypothetical protein
LQKIAHIASICYGAQPVRKTNFRGISAAIERAFEQMGDGEELTSTKLLDAVRPLFADCPTLSMNVCCWLIKAKKQRRVEELPPKARVKTYRKATGK